MAACCLATGNAASWFQRGNPQRGDVRLELMRHTTSGHTFENKSWGTPKWKFYSSLVHKEALISLIMLEIEQFYSFYFR